MYEGYMQGPSLLRYAVPLSSLTGQLKDYIQEANGYIGYSTIKTLSKNSLITFRKVTENEILEFSYEDLKSTDLRNGYLHKHNIHKSEQIENIRKATFNIIFLLLGGCNLTGDKKMALGFSDESFTDYYRLCEYVNFHANELFYLEFADGEEKPAFGAVDPKARVVGNKTEYSAVYFREMRENGNTWGFREEYVPRRITIGKFVFGYDDRITVDPVKVKVIFEDGKFVGPSIAEEEKLDY